MALKFEELEILKKAESNADGIWKDVVRWDPFMRNTLGKQLTRAADSIGATISEAFGRYHFGEKAHFLYYARGSLYETKYWLNRAQSRQLFTAENSKDCATQLSDLARQLNAFISHLKSQQSINKSQSTRIGETTLDYLDEPQTDPLTSIFTEEENKWIETTPNT